MLLVVITYLPFVCKLIIGVNPKKKNRPQFNIAVEGIYRDFATEKTPCGIC